jgi:hypothetical protein
MDFLKKKMKELMDEDKDKPQGDGGASARLARYLSS